MVCICLLQVSASCLGQMSGIAMFYHIGLRYVMCPMVSDAKLAAQILIRACMRVMLFIASIERLHA
jgi:hypothetical protein